MPRSRSETVVHDRARITTRRLEGIAATAPDHRSAQRAALEELREVLPYDVAVIGTVDPATVLWTSCVMAGIDPDPQRESFVFENEYRSDDLLKVADLAGSPLPSGRLSAFDEESRAGSPRYRALRGMGAIDELRCALVDGDSCWGSIELYRSGASGPFNDQDVTTAASLSRALARTIRLSLLRQAAFLPERVADPPGVLVLESDGTINALSPACERLVDDCGTTASVPPVFRSLLARLNVTGDDSATTTVIGRSGGWIRLHATRLLGDYGQRFSIVLEPVRRPGLADTVARVYGFTPRERDVITCMARGLSSKEIGASLGISPYTVNDHVKSVFQKVGVQSRQQLIAALFFEQCLPLRQIQAIPGPYGWFLDHEPPNEPGESRDVESPSSRDHGRTSPVS